MAIFPPQTRIWWNEPVAKAELVWIAVAFLWGLIMFFMMIYWHIYGQQNLSTQVGRIDPGVFEQRTNEFAEKFKVRDEGDTGVPVVRPPPGGDAYMLARTFDWWPVLELERGRCLNLKEASLTNCIFHPLICNMGFHCCPST
jgi:cytochrome c oxidase subunit 2